ncbi:LytR C-terminal domain-containing protein [Candidatus Latescibacterota bacterium]
MTKSFNIVTCISILVIVLSLISIFFLQRAINPQDTATETVVNSSVRVAVLNGCGREGLASKCVQLLRAKGFDVVNGLGENADSFDFDISVVLSRKSSWEKAELLAETLGVEEILDQRSDDPYLIEDVVVILGRDWNTLQLPWEDFID